MTGETNLSILIKTLQPVLNEGDYVFCCVQELDNIDFNQLLFYFKENEGITIVVGKEYADSNNLSYHNVFSWISLEVHSSLNAVGLTAAFSNALYEEGISCNVVAAFYHDHIFVGKADAENAMETLQKLSAGR